MHINSKSNILVIDDDSMLNFIFCSFLSAKGFETLSATSVVEAVQILQTNDSLDLILLDYHLGDSFGIELLSSDLAATYKKSIPVIMTGDNADPDFLEVCFSLGVSDFIVKPVNLPLLALKVDALIKSMQMKDLIATQKLKLEQFKYDAEREEQVAKFTYEYLLQKYSSAQSGVEIWQKSFAAFSGDMALVKKSPSGSLFFMLVDATGHGLSAAITILPVLTTFHDMVSGGFQMQHIVTCINRRLVDDTPADRFVAANIIEINPQRHEINVWNGGMPSVYWINQGVIVHEFRSQHMALGILADDEFEVKVETVTLPHEGFLFTFSDGLTEQENQQGAAFTTAKVLAIVAQQPQDLLTTLADSLKAHVGDDNYDDDVSVCLIRPQDVLADCDDGEKTIASLIDGQSNPFFLEIRLSGKKLGSCDIPPLCNYFLKQIGSSQELRQKLFSILAEMVSNSIDHGILKLSSSLKNDEDGFMSYLSEREKRISVLDENDFVNVKLVWNSDAAKNCLIIEVEDSGQGFGVFPQEMNMLDGLSGRGISLIKKLSESVEIFSPGNKIMAILK